MFARRLRHEDGGFALLSAIFIGVVVGAVGIAAVSVAVDGTRSNGVNSATGRSLAAAEAGVTRGQEYLHSPFGGPRTLLCSPACTGNALSPWGNSTTPMSLTFGDGSSAKVWIEVQQPFAPPAYLTGSYIVHALGTTSDGRATRAVDQTVGLTTVSFPLGVYTDQSADFQGNGVIHNESMFSNSCITYRGDDHLAFQGIDSYYNIPNAPHSTTYVTKAQTTSCGNPGSGIHASAICNSTAFSGGPPGSPVYDQDGAGDTFVAPRDNACINAANQYTTTSKFTYQDLTQKYGYRPRGLTPEAYAFLKQQAQKAGTYWTTTSFTAPTASTSLHPILYFDLASFGTVSVGSLLNSYGWVDEAGGTCTGNHPSVIIVVMNGNLNFPDAGFDIAGAIFAPDGQFTFGNGNFIGTSFSKTYSSRGTGTLGLNDCYAKNTSPPLLDPKPIHFRQVDQAG
jgi:hypothetical protein